MNDVSDEFYDLLSLYGLHERRRELVIHEGSLPDDNRGHTRLEHPRNAAGTFAY